MKKYSFKLIDDKYAEGCFEPRKFMNQYKSSGSAPSSLEAPRVKSSVLKQLR